MAMNRCKRTLDGQGCGGGRQTDKRCGGGGAMRALAHSVSAVGRTDTDRGSGGGFFGIWGSACLTPIQMRTKSFNHSARKGRRRELKLKWSVERKETAVAVNDSPSRFYSIFAPFSVREARFP